MYDWHELMKRVFVLVLLNKLIMKLQSDYKEQVYAIMRIVVGLLFIEHGIQKAIALSNGTMPASNFLMVLAAIIETAGGFLIITGWQTRIAAFIASGEMAVAFFTVHINSGFLPIKNKGELAVLYCFVFLFIAAYGSGIWSVDNSRRRGERERERL
jgi:putative oxidoreductase